MGIPASRRIGVYGTPRLQASPMHPRTPPFPRDDSADSAGHRPGRGATLPPPPLMLGVGGASSSLYLRFYLNTLLCCY